ncbi:MAG: SprT family zinc-dependent metalloprotease [Pseudomonadota bacterium]
MAERHILAGDPPIEVELRENSQARRLTLRVASRDGRVTLTMPRGTRVATALDFAQERRGWLLKHLSRVAPEERVEIGGDIPIEGRMLKVLVGEGRAPEVTEDAFLVPKRAAATPGRAVTAFLKLRARDRLTEASDRYAAALRRRYSRITLRDTRTRWGSCSSAGALMYSWRLAMAPPAVLDYVAAHEVAHLVEMNHSPAFWANVARICPDYEIHRRWLRDNGTALQRIVLD